MILLVSVEVSVEISTPSQEDLLAIYIHHPPALSKVGNSVSRTQVHAISNATYRSKNSTNEQESPKQNHKEALNFVVFTTELTPTDYRRFSRCIISLFCRLVQRFHHQNGLILAVIGTCSNS
jgi:hypothetical protein